MGKRIIFAAIAAAVIAALPGTIAAQPAAKANAAGLSPTRAANTKLERYTFDPGMIVVKRGDCVTLRIHSVKGSHHNVTIEGTEIGSEGVAITNDAGAATGKAVARANPNAFEDPAKLKAGEFARGEQVTLRFQANQAGTYRMICEVHTFIGAKGELKGYDDKNKPLAGPMVGYLVLRYGLRLFPGARGTQA